MGWQWYASRDNLKRCLRCGAFVPEDGYKGHEGYRENNDERQDAPAIAKVRRNRE